MTKNATVALRICRGLLWAITGCAGFGPANPFLAAAQDAAKPQGPESPITAQARDRQLAAYCVGMDAGK
jgi:hypothetical protein